MLGYAASRLLRKAPVTAPLRGVWFRRALTAQTRVELLGSFTKYGSKRTQKMPLREAGLLGAVSERDRSAVEIANQVASPTIPRERVGSIQKLPAEM